MIDFYFRQRLDLGGVFGLGNSTHGPFPAKHKLFTFPGGESHVTLDLTDHTGLGDQIAYVRGATGDDIVGLAMWNDAVKRQRPNDKRFLFLPYLPGARADRGAPLGAKVYADMVNAMGFDAVVCVDPHSDVAPALYDRLIVLKASQVIEPMIGFDGIIAPDKGARTRAEEIATLFALPVYQADKHRDFATGKLWGFSCEGLPRKMHTPDFMPVVPRYLLVDDICDGGGTFIGLAEHLGLKAEQLALWVTHGIFSNGAINPLSKHFGKIITTDSLAFAHTGTTEIALLPAMVKALTSKGF